MPNYTPDWNIHDGDTELRHPVDDPLHAAYIEPFFNTDTGNEEPESLGRRSAARLRYDEEHLDWRNLVNARIHNNNLQIINTELNPVNYQDEPITCNQCGMRCTRPTPKTIRTKTCKVCRKNLRKEEKRLTLPQEKGVKIMDDKKETIIVNQSPIKKGVLQKMRIQRIAEGIQLVYESPIMQHYFKNSWFYLNSAPDKDGTGSKWRSNVFPTECPPRAYYNPKEISNDYRQLLYLSYGDSRLISNGKPNLGFLQAVNDYPVDDKGNAMKKTPATELFRKDMNLEYMNPDKPIIVTIEGMFPNKTLDDYLQRVKEVMYKIYSENLMPFDKSMIITMESHDETKNQTT